jgi:transposase
MGMRGSDARSGSLFSYVDLEARVRRDHPLRVIREIANAALVSLNEDLEVLYPRRLGRPSLPPERLLRAMLLQAFYGIRSECQLMERMKFDLLFRWFVGLGVDDPAWDRLSSTTNRDRLLGGEIAANFLQAVLAQPQMKRLLSSEHFSVDGTLIEAWASIKSFRRKDGQDKRQLRSGPQCRARLPQGEATFASSSPICAAATCPAYRHRWPRAHQWQAALHRHRPAHDPPPRLRR